MSNKMKQIGLFLERISILKQKQPYKRGRNWTIVVYLDSSPEDWEDVIKQEPAVISPLHDKDVTEDGERKTALPCDFKL